MLLARGRAVFFYVLRLSGVSLNRKNGLQERACYYLLNFLRNGPPLAGGLRNYILVGGWA